MCFDSIFQGMDDKNVMLKKEKTENQTILNNKLNGLLHSNGIFFCHIHPPIQSNESHILDIINYFNQTFRKMIT